uniref:Uncharacterized protein n=1 Tax=Lygus hesperus TaxID=30085 RepID=A0A0K8TB10_LYGHE
MKIMLVITFAVLVVVCLATEKRVWVEIKDSKEDPSCLGCPVKPEERNPPCPYAQDDVPPGHLAVRPGILGLVRIKAHIIKEKFKKLKKLQGKQHGQSGLVCQ